MLINYYLVSLSFKFHEDPCSNMRAQVENMRTRNKTSALGITSYELFCATIFTFRLITYRGALKYHASMFSQIFEPLPPTPALSGQAETPHTQFTST